jgi:KDO2-lipid IV(A) lauroyltransferase
MGATTDRATDAGASLEGRQRPPAKPETPGRGLAHAPHRRLDPGDGLSRRLSRLNERLVMVGYRFASWLFGHLPLAVSWPAVRALMLAAYVLWPAKRRIIIANAMHILGRPAGDPETRALARRIYQTYARYVVELMRLPSLPEHVPAMLVDADGERGVDSFTEIWARYSAEGRGVIAASIHIGSIETLVAAVAARGFPTYALADDTAYPELYALLQAQRRRWGIEVFAWRNLRRTFSVLREPAILGLLVDWGYRSDGIPVRLFGDWTTLPAGPAALAAKTGAVIVPMVCRRRPNGRFAAQHFAPIEVADDSSAELARATQALADAVAEMVRPAPEQWYTFKPIWPASAEEAAALALRAGPTARAEPAS